VKGIYRILTLVLALASLSCSFSVDTGGSNPPAQATVLVVPITATQPAPAVQPQPTATSQPPDQPLAPTQTFQAASATPNLLRFYVSGYVWHDTCTQVDGPVPIPLPAGCLFDASSGMYADGIRQAGEPGIAGVTVRIEINCAYGAFTTATDATGYYSMSFTVDASAGVSKQLICLSVDATSAANSGVLIPGGWTAPHVNSGVAEIQLTIPVETQNTVNFGWDFQF
jgi:hypothetical protein